MENDRGYGPACLKAAEAVENSIKYWEEKGLIERLRHSDIDLIAFIHKTCGEFAAAMHLAEMQPNEARQAVKPVLSNPDWEEILDFATDTPLASMLAEMLATEYEAVDSDEATLNRLFRVLARPEASLSPTVRMSFLEQVFTLARSEDRQKGHTVSVCA